jgi:addiction module RelE/StbE family toxin
MQLPGYEVNMRVVFKKKFKKQLQKLPNKIEQKFIDRLKLFLADQKSPLLHVHTLSGSLYPFKSMNVTADYRALFLIENDVVIFYEIGTHSELYGK